MIRIKLPEVEAQHLELAFRQTTDRKDRDCLQFIHLARRGRPHQQSAADLGITPRAIQRWLNTYLARELDGLRPQQGPGPSAEDPDHPGR